MNFRNGLFFSKTHASIYHKLKHVKHPFIHDKKNTAELMWSCLINNDDDNDDDDDDDDHKWNVNFYK